MRPGRRRRGGDRPDGPPGQPVPLPPAPLSPPSGCTVSVGRDLAVPAAVAWDVLTDTRAWPDWGPSVRAVDVADPYIGPGVEGRVRTVGGLWLPFRVTGWEPGRWWSWRVGGVAATGHRVTPRPGGSRVSFEVPVGAAAYLLVCGWALRRVDRLASARAPGFPGRAQQLPESTG